MTVQELIYLLEAQPDNNAVVNIAVFTETGCTGTLEEHLYVHTYDDGFVYIQNKEWDDGAS